MRIGVLTGGGDCPGLNAVIRAVVRKGVGVYGHEFVGFRDGWKGPVEELTMPAGRPGRCPRHPAPRRHDPRLVAHEPVQGRRRRRRDPRERCTRLGVDALIAIGGEDTLGVATKLHEQGVNVVGVPKTIDNDLNATDYTFGFDTAVNIAMEAIDRLHTTAESHHRALIVEVMGRHAGWIALHAGLAGGANVILIPELPFDIDRVCAYVESRYQAHYAPIIVVAEGATPDGGEKRPSTKGWTPSATSGWAGIGEWLAEQVESRTGKEARTTVLGHIQRGGTPVGVRPRAGHAVRPARHRRRPRTATSARWSPCAAPTSSACRSPTRPPSSRPSRRSCTPRPRSSSAEARASLCCTTWSWPRART